MAEKIEIKKGDKTLKVTERVFNVVYSEHGFQKVVQHDNAKENHSLLGMPKAELAKVNKDDIKAFLENEGFEYDPNAKKENLIALIAGDDNDQK